MRKKAPGKKKAAATRIAARKKAGSRAKPSGSAASRKKGVATLAASGKVAEELAAALQRLSPRLQHVAVEHPDPTMNFRYLKLAEVAYITSKSDVPGRATMLVTVHGESFYSGESLTGWMRRFEKGNPWFMKTHGSYVVNLARITAIRYGSARDLWFEGLEEPVVSVVSDSYRAAFDERVGL